MRSDRIAVFDRVTFSLGTVDDPRRYVGTVLEKSERCAFVEYHNDKGRKFQAQIPFPLIEKVEKHDTLRTAPPVLSTDAGNEGSVD